MTVLAHRTELRSNELLASLGPRAWAELAPALTRVHLPRKEVVGEREQEASHVYFPCGAVLSVLAYMQSGAAVEVGTIGKEGFFGLELLVGSTHWTETTVCQVEGDSLRMPARAFLEAVAGETPLRRITQRYLVAYLSNVSQSVACNRLHNIEERFARWVLMTHDRVDGDQFFLTQEYIADMLGTHRPSVSLVAGAFQQAGYIKYSRGWMTILNRAGLEEASCECYEASARQFAKLRQPDTLAMRMP
ncbi:MAG TPA: Crp/Fnr family transcriptional regulator [Telluria sp.]|jgi:CRP-like cAMP-binding protein